MKKFIVSESVAGPLFETFSYTEASVVYEQLRREGGTGYDIALFSGDVCGENVHNLEVVRWSLSRHT